MSDHAYDISYLLESEVIEPSAPALRVVKAPRAPASPSLAALQEAMARELLKEDHAHAAMIQAYLRMADPVDLERSR
jgi:hypothetical protein